YAFSNGEVISGLVNLVTGATPLAGDFNADGVVDAADYTVWRNNLNGNESALRGNGNGNGIVDAADYTLWKDNYGETAGAAVALAATAVPEPSTYALLIIAAGAMVCLTTRRRMAAVPCRIAALAATTFVVGSS